jgi:hypothetical protein
MTTPSFPSDTELLRQMRAGTVAAFEAPYLRHQGPLFRFTVSDESWYSPELQVTVMSKHSDPRAGENVYRLTAIKREEPAAALFAPPPDYTIRDRTPDVHLMEKKAP